MGVLSSVLLILGIITLIGSLIILIFPKISMGFMRKISKNPKAVKKAGLIELIVAVILILIGMNI